MPEMVLLKESTMLVDWGVLSVAGFNFKSGGVESGLVALEKINVLPAVFAMLVLAISPIPPAA